MSFERGHSSSHCATSLQAEHFMPSIYSIGCQSCFMPGAAYSHKNKHRRRNYGNACIVKRSFRFSFCLHAMFGNLFAGVRVRGYAAADRAGR